MSSLRDYLYSVCPSPVASKLAPKHWPSCMQPGAETWPCLPDTTVLTAQGASGAWGLWEEASVTVQVTTLISGESHCHQGESFSQRGQSAENAFAIPAFLLRSGPLKVAGAMHSTFQVPSCGPRMLVERGSPSRAACIQFMVLWRLKRRHPVALLETTQIFGRTSTRTPGAASHGVRAHTVKGPYLKSVVVVSGHHRSPFLSQRWPFPLLLWHAGKRTSRRSAYSHSWEGIFPLTFESVRLQRPRS